VPTTLLFGLVPALRLSRVQIGATMARGSRQVGASLSRRGSQALIAAEVALAVVLTAGAGLMIRSFALISAVPLGFDSEGLVTMQVLPLDRDPAAHKDYYWALQQRLQATPGIASVGIVDNFPLAGGGSYTGVEVAGQQTSTSVFDMTPGYLETIGATLLEGRLPTDAEYVSGFRGVVLNQSAARAIFPDGPAVGRQLTRAGNDTPPWTVTGVISDLRHGGPLADVSGMRGFQVFFPLTPTEFRLNAAMTVVVRASRGVRGIAERLRQAAQDVGSPVLIERIRTADELFGTAVITPRRRVVLLALLGALGLTLALVGVFGMTAYAVARRTSEVGVRMALGARAGQVVATMLRDAAAPIVAGTLAGVGGALLATRAIESFLFQTAPTDPVTLATVAGAVAVTGCVAALVPSLRAAKVDPALTLRSE
jgi:putative ABC transport system permease protein